MSAWRQVRRVRSCAVSQVRNWVASLICSPGEAPGGRSQRGVLGAGAQTRKDFPGGEPVDELGMGGIGDRVESNPIFQRR
jgi:hypothetical protein